MVTVTTTAFDYIPENWTYDCCGGFSTASTTDVDVLREYDSAVFEIDVPNNYYLCYKMTVRTSNTPNGYTSLYEDGSTLIKEINKGGSNNYTMGWKSQFQNTSGSTHTYKRMMRCNNTTYPASEYYSFFMTSTDNIKSLYMWSADNNTTLNIPLKLNITDFYILPEKYDLWDLEYAESSSGQYFCSIGTMGISLSERYNYVTARDTSLPNRVHASIRNNVLTTGLPISFSLTISGSSQVTSGGMIWWSGSRIAVS